MVLLNMFMIFGLCRKKLLRKLDLGKDVQIKIANSYFKKILIY